MFGIDIDERVTGMIDRCEKRNRCDSCPLSRECHQLWDNLVSGDGYEA